MLGPLYHYRDRILFTPLTSAATRCGGICLPPRLERLTVEIWAWVLMPNHVHQVRERLASMVMDEAQLLAALRYAVCNQLRAGLVTRPEDWQWSSVAARDGWGWVRRGKN